MILVVFLLLLALMLGPQFLSQRLLRSYGDNRPDLPGTGGELAQHLVERFQLEGVNVEVTTTGDHYDPNSHTVRLRGEHFNGRSVSAVAVAAHEVGHAIQHATGTGGIMLRTRLAVIATVAAKAAQISLISIPILVGLMPGFARVGLIVVVVGIVLSTVLHLVTLPVEWDASFKKALPILQEGQYLSDKDMRAAKKILTVCAFTYVSGSLASLIGLWRWLRYLRFMR